MTEPLQRRHPLEDFIAEQCVTSTGEPGVTVRAKLQVDHINLRGRYSDERFRNAAESVLQQSLPTKPNTWIGEKHIVYWLGPDEWLISADTHRQVGERLSAGLDPLHSAVNAQNGGLIQLNLSGRFTTALLAKGCTLDFHPTVFKAGCCAQTLLAKADVMIALLDETPAFSLLVRRSFAEYLAQWLAHSGNEYGISFGFEAAIENC